MGVNTGERAVPRQNATFLMKAAFMPPEGQAVLADAIRLT